jgi:hypothetical protein
VAVGAFAGASLSATTFEVTRAAVCGVYVATGGTIDLSNGVVAECTIGACIQSASFDSDRLTGGGTVSYRDNGINLDATSLPVPEPSAPIPE